MKWPANFYFRQKTSEEKYGKKPPGTLVAARLLNRKPAWRKPVQAGELKKKKLIFTDFTYNKRPLAERDKIDDILCKLIDDGFEVYDDNGHALTKQSVKMLRPPDYYVSQELMARVTSFPKDEICLLDDYLLTALKKPSLREKYLAGEKIPREFNIEHLPDIRPNYNSSYSYHTADIERSILWLLKANPPLTAIKITTYNIALVDIIINIVNQTFPSLPIHYEFDTWHSYEVFRHEKSKNKDKAKAIVYQNLGSIKKMDLVCRNGFFKKGNFYFSGAAPIYEQALDYSSSNHVNNLTEIELEGIKFEDNDLLHLLFENKDLTVLIINRSEIYETNQLDAALQNKALPNLAMLHLVNTGASIAFLIRLLESSPNLKRIESSTTTIDIIPASIATLLTALYALKARSMDNVDCDRFFKDVLLSLANKGGGR